MAYETSIEPVLITLHMGPLTEWSSPQAALQLHAYDPVQDPLNLDTSGWSQGVHITQIHCIT